MSDLYKNIPITLRNGMIFEVTAYYTINLSIEKKFTFYYECVDEWVEEEVGKEYESTLADIKGVLVKNIIDPLLTSMGTEINFYKIQVKTKTPIAKKDYLILISCNELQGKVLNGTLGVYEFNIQKRKSKNIVKREFWGSSHTPDPYCNEKERLKLQAVERMFITSITFEDTALEFKPVLKSPKPEIRANAEVTVYDEVVSCKYKKFAVRKLIRKQKANDTESTTTTKSKTRKRTSIQ